MAVVRLRLVQSTLVEPIIGTPTRFQRGKQSGTYVGMIPCEESSARKPRLGHISKQGNSLLRYLLVEAAQAAVRSNPPWRRRYIHLRCVDKRALPRWRWGESWGFACTGCGGMVVSIHHLWSSVRTRDSSLPDMA
jgi:hypothetical protein